MKLDELRSIVNRPEAEGQAIVHIVDCEAGPCVLVGVAQGGGEVHLFCAHQESSYPDGVRLITPEEQARREAAALERTEAGSNVPE